MLGVPKITPSVDDLLRRLSIESYSQLWFIIAEGNKAKSAKGKGAWVEVQEQPGTNSNGLLPTTSCGNTCEMLPTGEAH